MLSFVSRKAILHNYETLNPSQNHQTNIVRVNMMKTTLSGINCYDDFKIYDNIILSTGNYDIIA